MASTLEKKEKVEEEEESSENAAAGEEEDTGAHITPIVRLQEVAVSTGEEDEDCLLDLKAKLYRFDRDQWKERGVGSVRLLRHRQTGKVRLVMRQNKTLKICANHLVLPTMTTQEHAGNEKSCVWHAADFADGELKEETFAIRFASAENCKAFREKIEEIAESQGKKDTAEGSAAAELIEKLSVENKAEEQKPEGEKELAPAKEKEKDAEEGAPVKKE